MSYGRFLTVLSLVVAFAALGLVGAGFYHLNRETSERRSQTCTWFEGDHLDDVQQLRRAYKRIPEALEFYLEAAPKRLHPFLVGAVTSDVERLEAEARVDAAPEFCDEESVGLPEPDPVIPKRPKNLLP
jgi:hypothetical protein